MTWRPTDRANIAQLLGMPIDQDRPDSRLDRRMVKIVENDALFSTNYVTRAQDVIDKILALPGEESVEDYGLIQIDIPGQIRTMRSANSSLIQFRQKRGKLLSELTRIIGIAPQQGYTLRS
jgi:hypothetical protein